MDKDHFKYRVLSVLKDLNDLIDDKITPLLNTPGIFYTAQQDEEFRVEVMRHLLRINKTTLDLSFQYEKQ